MELYDVSNVLARSKDSNFGTPQSLMENLLERDKNTHTVEGEEVSAFGNGSLQAVIDNRTYGLNDWSFTQLCRLSAAPPSFIRRLSFGLAAASLNYTRKGFRDNKTVALVLNTPEGEVLRAINSTVYSRYSDSQLLGEVMEHSTTFTPKGLYSSDRDVFLFYVNEEDRIEVDGENLGRGFMVWNSEVGSKSFGFQTFLYNYICDNHIVFGTKEVFKVNRRHVGDMSIVRKKLIEGINSLRDRKKAQRETDIVREAMRTIYAEDNESAIERLRSRRIGLSKKGAEEVVKAAHEHPGAGAGLTVWGIAQGITAIAKDIPYMDDRLDFESKAGKVLAVIH